MTTTALATTRTDHDVELAVIPLDFTDRPNSHLIPFLSSIRLNLSLRNIKSSFSITQAIKISIGALVGTLTLISAWWALDLAMWTSVKDFRDDCRQQLQSFNITSTPCQKALRRPLQKPPTWRGYLGKATDVLTGRSVYRYVSDDPDEDGGHEPKRSPRKWLASKAARRSPPTLHDECGFYDCLEEVEEVREQHELPDDIQKQAEDAIKWEEYREVAREGIRKQGDAAIMYGGLEDCNETRERDRKRREIAVMYDGLKYSRLTFPIDFDAIPPKGPKATFHLPLEEAQQEGRFTRWEYFQEEFPCDMWFNKTVSGTVQEIQMFPVPDRWLYPHVFEELMGIMPANHVWREDCTYTYTPGVPYEPSGFFREWHRRTDLAPVLILTFFLVVMGHEIVYGGFARKTRWKWQ